MSRLNSFGCVFIIFCFFLCTSKEAFSQPVQCQNWTAAEWDQFLDQNINPKQYYPELTYSKIKAAKEQCTENISKAGLEPCFSRISGYYDQFVPGKGGMFTSKMNDRDYYNSQPPEAVELPPELKNATNALPKNWKEVAEKNGWKWALFHSGTANEPRLVMYLPAKGDEKYDRLLVYYAFSKSNDPTTYVGLQMQSIEKTKDPTQPAQYHFKSWGFNGVDGTPLPRASGGRCVSCHISGPRAIEPAKNPVFQTELGGVTNLEAFNKLILRKNLDYSQYYDLKNFPSHLKVGEGKCTGCHDGTSRNSLSYSLNSDGSFYAENIHRKVVREETMPAVDGEMLTREERATLAKYVQDDYDTKIKQWLTETKCTSLNPTGLKMNTPPVTVSPRAGQQ